MQSDSRGFNLFGQQVAKPIDEIQPANKYWFTFESTDLRSGIYVYRLHACSNMIAKKMILIK